MTTEDIADELSEILFAEDSNTFAILDGASIRDLRQKLFTFDPERVCLYAGDLQPDVESVAPYVVKLERDSEFTDWILTSGWGKHWGVFGSSYDGLQKMRAHFRSLLTVFDETGKPLRFRYYDPRVLRLYLPTCNPEELKTFFGPMNMFFAEDEDPGTLIRFELMNDLLRRKKIDLR